MFDWHENKLERKSKHVIFFSIVIKYLDIILYIIFHKHVLFHQFPNTYILYINSDILYSCVTYFHLTWLYTVHKNKEI